MKSDDNEAQRRIEAAREGNKKELLLARCGLEVLPYAIGELKQLKTLDLSYNKLTVLPESIGNLRHLETLNLCHNRLASLPESIANLHNLEKLNLSYNRLTTIPKFSSVLPNLKSLSIADPSGAAESLKSGEIIAELINAKKTWEQTFEGKLVKREIHTLFYLFQGYTMGTVANLGSNLDKDFKAVSPQDVSGEMLKSIAKKFGIFPASDFELENAYSEAPANKATLQNDTPENDHKSKTKHKKYIGNEYIHENIQQYPIVRRNEYIVYKAINEVLAHIGCTIYSELKK